MLVLSDVEFDVRSSQSHKNNSFVKQAERQKTKLIQNDQKKKSRLWIEIARRYAHSFNFSFLIIKKEF